jgi:hypothetical protein
MQVHAQRGRRMCVPGLPDPRSLTGTVARLITVPYSLRQTAGLTGGAAPISAYSGVHNAPTKSLHPTSLLITDAF